LAGRPGRAISFSKALSSRWFYPREEKDNGGGAAAASNVYRR
jgi:hypothetical protein